MPPSEPIAIAVVAAEDERHLPLADRLVDELGEPRADLHDRPEVAVARVADLDRLGDRRADVALVDARAGRGSRMRARAPRT